MDAGQEGGVMDDEPKGKEQVTIHARQPLGGLTEPSAHRPLSQRNKRRWGEEDASGVKTQKYQVMPERKGKTMVSHESG